MISRMTYRARRAILILTCMTTLAFSTAARAQDEEKSPDARLMGYPTEVAIGGGNAGAYLLLGFLAVLTCGILFKNANRSHLD